MNGAGCGVGACWWEGEATAIIHGCRRVRGWAWMGSGQRAAGVVSFTVCTVTLADSIPSEGRCGHRRTANGTVEDEIKSLIRRLGESCQIRCLKISQNLPKTTKPKKGVVGQDRNWRKAAVAAHSACPRLRDRWAMDAGVGRGSADSHVGTRWGFPTAPSPAACCPLPALLRLEPSMIIHHGWAQASGTGDEGLRLVHFSVA